MANEKALLIVALLALLVFVVAPGLTKSGSVSSIATGGAGTNGAQSTGTVNNNNFNITPVAFELSPATGNLTEIALNQTTWLDGIAVPFSGPSATPSTGSGAGFLVPRGSSGTVYIGANGNASGDTYYAWQAFTSTQTSAFSSANTYAPAITAELAAKPATISFNNGTGPVTSGSLLASGTANAITPGTNIPTGEVITLTGSGTGFFGRNAYDICFGFNNTNVSKVWPVPTGTNSGLYSVVNTNAPFVDNEVVLQQTAAANQLTQCYEVQTQQSANPAQMQALGLPATATFGLPPQFPESFQVYMNAPVTPVSSNIGLGLNDKTDYIVNTGTASGSHLVNSYTDPNNNGLGKLSIWQPLAIVVN